MIAFANVVTLLCTSMNIGCGQLPQSVRIVSLVPFADNLNEALSGQYSSNTSNLQRKLKNPANFGPNGIVQVGGLEFTEIDLSANSNQDTIRQQLEEADILYWNAISTQHYQAYYQQLIPAVQRRDLVLLQFLDYDWQNNYTQAYGYTVQQTSNRPLRVQNLDNIFGSPGQVQTQGFVVKITNTPAYVTKILVDSNGETRGVAEVTDPAQDLQTKFIFGDGNLVLNTLITDSSDQCDTDDQTKFICNVFGTAVRMAQRVQQPQSQGQQ